MKEALARNPLDGVRVDHVNAGEGQPLAVALVKAQHPPVRDPHGVEPGAVVQGHGHIEPGAQVVVVDPFEVDIVKQIAVYDQHRVVIQAVDGQAQAAAGAEDLRLALHQYFRPVAERRLDLVGQVMTVDQHRLSKGGVQLVEQPVEQRPVGHREERLGADICIGPETGTVTGGEKDGLHGEIRGRLILTGAGNCSN